MPSFFIARAVFIALSFSPSALPSFLAVSTAIFISLYVRWLCSYSLRYSGEYFAISTSDIHLKPKSDVRLIYLSCNAISVNLFCKDTTNRVHDKRKHKLFFNVFGKHDGCRVFKVGISFSTKERTVTEWKYNED